MALGGEKSYFLPSLHLAVPLAAWGPLRLLVCAGHGGKRVGHPTVPSCQQTGCFAPQKGRVLGFVLFGSAPALKSPREELFKVSVCFPAPGTSRTPTQRA